MGDGRGAEQARASKKKKKKKKKLLFDGCSRGGIRVLGDFTIKQRGLVRRLHV